MCWGWMAILLLLPTLLPAQNWGAVVSELHAQVNAARQTRNASALRRDSRLDSAAALQARWCAEHGLLQHVRPQGRLRSVEDRFKHVRFNYGYYGENLLYIPLDVEEISEVHAPTLAAEVLQLWLDSPGHATNLRSKNYTHTGIALFYHADSERLYACQVFATPAGSAARKPRR